MYEIDKKHNLVLPLQKRTFSELGFRERDHLQEWIAKNPEILGEELLIIQKEFDGWTETRERIDLLAIDKNGMVVVIENKLDDSGKDVAWQAMKYAAYCSSLSKTNILDVFQTHLNNSSEKKNARDILCDFLDFSDFEEVVLNEGFNQRIILVGARFRPEVTSTCLWLINHNIDVRCIRVVPYGQDERLFLNVEQIIPPPEAEEFMVKIGSKEVEEKSSKGTSRRSHKLRLAFFTKLLESLTSSAAKTYANRSPGTDHWLSGSTGISGVHYSFSLLQTAIRVELAMQRSSGDENKFIFDKLILKKDKIQSEFGEELAWTRLEDKKASRIIFEIPFDSYDESNWEEAINWMNDKMNLLISAVQPHLDDLSRQKSYLSVT
jgi:hypothetical protein